MWTRWCAGNKCCLLLMNPPSQPHALPSASRAPVVERFKTKAGRDLAIKRSGEALGSYCSWWNPENVTVVVKGRDEDGDCGFGGSGGGGSGEGVNGLLLVLPHGRSVADVLEKVGHVCHSTLTAVMGVP